MQQGWISLHRKILDNPIVCKDSDYFSVWCYLLLNATHKEQDKLFNGKRVTLTKGQLITGRKTIAELFKISESKVQRILKKLEIEQQIEQLTCHENRLVTVLNWHLYQNSEQPIEQQVNNERTTSEQQVNTNNNVFNENNENNEEKKNDIIVVTKKRSQTPMAFDEHSFEMKFVNGFIILLKQRNEQMKEPNKQSWAAEVDKMIRIDKRSEEDMVNVLKYAVKDSFWQNNILSPMKLRKQFDTLYMQMKNNPKSKGVSTEWDID
jgi:hypothetical protein